MAQLERGSAQCTCGQASHATRLVVLTGGPGAGKTAVLHMAQRLLCEHVAFLPEAASVVFGGGFPRQPTPPARRAAQRAIFHVQHEVEAMVLEEAQFALALCDRGSIDGLAYWPDDGTTYWQQTGADRATELARYAAVIHLRTPPTDRGYNNRNALRVETAREAAAADERILAVWEGHPRRTVIDSSSDFLEKARRTIEVIRAELPECCRQSAVRKHY